MFVYSFQWFSHTAKLMHALLPCLVVSLPLGEMTAACFTLGLFPLCWLIPKLQTKTGVQSPNYWNLFYANFEVITEGILRRSSSATFCSNNSQHWNEIWVLI